MLWFGDERGYNATFNTNNRRDQQLWFGDERGYNATGATAASTKMSCGLVMKEDITQQLSRANLAFSCCCLVMKEDITQQKKSDR